MLFLLANLALAFYNVGIVWAHEVDIFRSWTFLELNTFRRVQAAHWRKLPYWLLAPVALSLLGAITLIQGPLLAKILRTHWIRTGLVSASALILFAWTVQALPKT